MDIKSLQWFLQLVQSGSFSSASRVLDITQPTLSRAIQKLEQDLDTQLVIRTQTGIKTTKSGAELQRRIAPVLNELASIEESIRNSSEQGVVRIGTTPLTSVMFLAPLIADISRKWPGIHLSLHEFSTDKIHESLLSGELDFGLGVYLHEDPTLVNIPLVDDVYVAYLHEDNPLSGKESLRFADLKNEKFNICSLLHATTQQIYSRCMAENFTPTINIESTRSLFLMQLTALNNGICILPRPYCATSKREHTKMIPIEGYPWVESMIYNRDTYLSSNAKLIMNYLKDAFKVIEEELSRSEDKNPHTLPCMKNWSR